MAARSPTRTGRGRTARTSNPARVGPKATVDAYLASWLGHVKARVRANTHRGYEALIKLYALPQLGEIPLSELHPLDIQDLYGLLLEREPQLSAGTVLNLHLVLHNAFGQAVRWGLVPVNPVSGAQPPRPHR